MAIGILSVIPVLIGICNVFWRSIKSLFKKPHISQNESQSSSIMFSNLIEESENQQTQVEQPFAEKPKIVQSLFDPCGIMNQTDYFNFLDDPEVNHFYSFFRVKKCNKKMVPGFFILAFVIVFMIFSVINDIPINKIPISTIVILIIRTLIYIFSIPFLMIFNFTGIFIDSKRTKEKHSYIRKLWIYVCGGYLILLISRFIFIIVCNKKFSTFVPEKLVYSNTSKPITTSEPASICDFKYYGLDLIQYSGMAALGQTKNFDISYEILNYIFTDNDTVDLVLFNNIDAYCYEALINNELLVVAFNSNINMDRTAFLMENFFNDFIPNILFKSVIPFYDLTYNLLLSRFMNFLSSVLTNVIGVPQISNHIASNIWMFVDRSMKKNVSTVFVGHSVGGIFAKAIGSNFRIPSVAFESLNNDRSKFNADISLLSDHTKYLINGYKMINVFSPSQIFSQYDSNSTVNIELPKWKSQLEYINPYEEMCMIAAGCVMNDHYDKFCGDTIGFDKYKYFFTLWNRTRSD